MLGVGVLSLTLMAPAGAAETAPAPLAASVADRLRAAAAPSLRADPTVLARGVARHEPARVVVLRTVGTRLRVEETRTIGRAATARTIGVAQQDPGVLSVGVDRRVAQFGRVGVDRANDRYRRRQWGMSLLAVEEAWRLSTGRGVVVAVVDSGVDGDHPDLAAAMTQGANTRRDHGDRSPATRDGNGHGTHIAGIIAARSRNRVGVVGVAPRARIMPVKVLGADGSGWTSDVVEGIVWAVDHGADVVNLSLGAPAAEWMAPAIRYAVARGVTVVAAAGNDASRQPLYPAAFPGVIAVSALDPSGRAAAYSNRGATVDLAAPGTNIVSTVPGGYGLMSGTSMAAPHVAGVAALVQSLDPGADPATILLRTAADLGLPGRDNRYGHGRVAPSAALRLAGR